MRNIAFFIAFLGVYASARCQSISQQVINFNGGFGANANNSITWSVGEMATQTFTTSSNILTEGFLQPDTSVTTYINPIFANAGQISVYPNPVRDILNIRADNIIIEKAAMYDMLGKPVLELSNTKTIPVATLAKGMYLLYVKDDAGNTVQIFKVTKI